MKTTRRTLFAALAGIVAWLKAPAVKAFSEPVEVEEGRWRYSRCGPKALHPPEECKLWAYGSGVPYTILPKDWCSIFRDGRNGISWAANFYPPFDWRPPNIKDGHWAHRSVYYLIRRGAVEYAKGISNPGYVSSLPVEARPLAVEYQYPQTIVKQALGEA